MAPAPLGGRDIADDDDFRISIAGAQEKSALLWFDGRWCKLNGTTPTTHIVKMPLGLVGGMRVDMSSSVEKEWLCSEILHAYGLPVARTQPLQFEDMKLLATSREPDRDRRTFFQAQVLFWMLRATDGHAKNFSLFLRPGGSYELAPLYDVLSAYPVLGKGANKLSPFKVKMAMAVRSKNTHWLMREIQRRHWLAVGAEHGVVTPDGRGAEFVVDDLVARTPEVIRVVRTGLPAGFPKAVADSILDGLQEAADKLAV